MVLIITQYMNHATYCSNRNINKIKIKNNQGYEWHGCLKYTIKKIIILINSIDIKLYNSYVKK